MYRRYSSTEGSASTISHGLIATNSASETPRLTSTRSAVSVARVPTSSRTPAAGSASLMATTIRPSLMTQPTRPQPIATQVQDTMCAPAPGAWPATEAGTAWNATAAVP